MCAVWTACTLGVTELGKAGVFIQFFPLAFKHHLQSFWCNYNC